MDESNLKTGDRPTGSGAPKPKASLLRRAVWLAIVLAVVAALAWTLWPQNAQQQASRRLGAGSPVPVVAATVQKGDMPVVLNALGTVTPLATVTVKTQISGRITEIAFKEGQTVKQGDFLAQIDPSPYQIALEQAQGQLLRDQALLKNAETDLARYRRLASQDSIARQQVDTQQSLVHQYEGTVAIDQAQVDNAFLNLDYCHIRAPVAGRVGLRQVDLGNYAQTSDANGIVVITQLHPISVIFTVSEDNLPAIMKRVRADASLEATAYDRSMTAKLATGVLATLDNQIDTSTGTLKLRAQFDNADETLFPNQFVNIALLVDTLHDADIVPSAAIQRGAPGTFVYLIKPDSTVAVQTVKLGPSEGDRVAILSGLDAGQQVVVDGADKLRDGAKIMLPNATSGANHASARVRPDRGKP